MVSVHVVWSSVLVQGICGAKRVFGLYSGSEEKKAGTCPGGIETKEGGK